MGAVWLWNEKVLNAETVIEFEMKAADFAAMMKGTLDVEKAALDGKIQFEGDPSLFANLAAILQPAT